MISFVDLDVQDHSDVMSRESQSVARTRRPAASIRRLGLGSIWHFLGTSALRRVLHAAVACNLDRRPGMEVS